LDAFDHLATEAKNQSKVRKEIYANNTDS
jgi:hypothetical protein